MSSLDVFLDLWFGVRSRPGDDPAAAVGRLLRFNRPAAPGTVDGDVEVLVVENQAVWLWGRTSDGRYVERENEPGAAWHETGETTEEFWLHQAGFDAVTNLPASRSARDFDPATVAGLEAGLRPLPCRPWSWPGAGGHTLHHRGSCVVMVCRDGEDVWVLAAAPTEPDLGWLDDLGLEWDESDTRRPE